MTCFDAALQRGNHIATIIGGVVVTLTLVLGLCTFRHASNREADAAAIKLMQDYFRFKFEHEDLANHPSDQPMDDRYKWFAAHNLLIAETIYKMNEGDHGWEESALDIVKDHKQFISDPCFRCDEYHAKFIAFVKKPLAEEGVKICPENKPPCPVR